MVQPSDTSDPCLRFSLNEHGIGFLKPPCHSLDYNPGAVVRTIEHGLSDVHLLRGLLVELDTDTHLSLVRVSTLIDHLCRLGVPVAVVVHTEKQRRLGHLMHYPQNTPIHAAFFTDRTEALRFLYRASEEAAGLPMQ